METANDLVIFTSILYVCGARSQLGSPCSERQACTGSQVCCRGVCVDGLKVCKMECLKDSDCNNSRGQECVNNYCDCIAPSCLLASKKDVKFVICVDDGNCYTGEKCRNRTCEARALTITTPKAKPQRLALNPALLAIVTIIGVLLFSFLFCCCLSKMKSERTSVKRREAKVKLKKDLRLPVCQLDNDNTVKPLLKPETQDSTDSFKKTEGTTFEKNIVSSEKDRGSLLPTAVISCALSPIREEDEEVEKEENSCVYGL